MPRLVARRLVLLPLAGLPVFREEGLGHLEVRIRVWPLQRELVQMLVGLLTGLRGDTPGQLSCRRPASGYTFFLKQMRGTV
jgi:hypothetical protein